MRKLSSSQAGRIVQEFMKRSDGPSDQDLALVTKENAWFWLSNKLTDMVSDMKSAINSTGVAEESEQGKSLGEALNIVKGVLEYFNGVPPFEPSRPYQRMVQERRDSAGL